MNFKKNNKNSSGNELKAVDIARYFNISRVSSSEALIKLCELGLIIYEGRKGIIITPKGVVLMLEKFNLYSENCKISQE